MSKAQSAFHDARVRGTLTAKTFGFSLYGVFPGKELFADVALPGDLQILVVKDRLCSLAQNFGPGKPNLPICRFSSITKHKGVKNTKRLGITLLFSQGNRIKLFQH